MTDRAFAHVSGLMWAGTAEAACPKKLLPPVSKAGGNPSGDSLPHGFSPEQGWCVVGTPVPENLVLRSSYRALIDLEFATAAAASPWRHWTSGRVLFLGVGYPSSWLPFGSPSRWLYTSKSWRHATRVAQRRLW